MAISISSATGIGTLAVDGTTMLTMANATGLLTANRTPPQSSPATTIATLGNIFGAAAFATPGYQIFASGLIVQWGSFTTANGASASTTFPIAFPNAALAANVTAITTPGSGNGRFAAVGSISKTTLSAMTWTDINTLVSANVYYVAIGW